MLPVPRRENSVVHRRSGQAVLSLFRLRRARHRGRLPDGLREHGVRRGGGRTRAPGRARSAPRRWRRKRAARGSRVDLHRARTGQCVLPATTPAPPTGVAGGGVPQGARPVGRDRIRVPARLRAARMGRDPRRARRRRIRARATHPGGAAHRARRRPALRPVPRPNHLSYP